MGSGKGDNLKNAMLDHVLGGPDYQRKSVVYLGLYNKAPTSAGGGTEVKGGGYSRVPIENNSENFPRASDGMKSNGKAITFPEATADWGNVSAAAIHGHDSDDHILYHGTPTANRKVMNGTQLEFAPGTLTFVEG